MRFLHTADWHLGRIFHGEHLTGDQAHLLDQFVDLARDGKVDAVLIAGDVYDRAVPPADAVELLGEVLDRLVVEAGVPVVLIAGNHDSPERISFCSGVLSGRGLHVRGVPEAEVEAVVLDDEHGPVHVFALPYSEPARARELFGDDEIREHDAAMRAAVERVRARMPQRVRSVLVAHAFAAGGEGSESERPLSVGGAGQVDVSCFDGFDYVALGHLHRPQSVGGRRIQYAGSLYKYSFAEADHVKSVSLVQMGPDGACSVERIALSPRLDVRCLEGKLEEILRAAEDDPNRDDYVMASLTDEGVVRDPMGRLRTRYPNALHVARPNLTPGPGGSPPAGDRRKLDVKDLFADFYEHKRGRKPDENQKEAFARIVDQVRSRQREA